MNRAHLLPRFCKNQRFCSKRTEEKGAGRIFSVNKTHIPGGKGKLPTREKANAIWIVSIAFSYIAIRFLDSCVGERKRFGIDTRDIEA